MATKKKTTKKKEIPECPPVDYRGDKTPEVIAWYKKYKPEVYATKYHAYELAKERGKVPHAI